MTTPATLFPFGQARLRTAERRIQNAVNVEKLSAHLDKITTSEVGLEGAGIFFVDSEYNIVLLRKFSSSCRKNPVYLVLKEPKV